MKNINLLAVSFILGLLITLFSGSLYVGWSGETYINGDLVIDENYYGLPFHFVTFRAVLWVDVVFEHSGNTTHQTLWDRSELLDFRMLTLDWMIFSWSIFAIILVAQRYQKIDLDPLKLKEKASK